MEDSCNPANRVIRFEAKGEGKMQKAMTPKTFCTVGGQSDGAKLSLTDDFLPHDVRDMRTG